MIWIRRLLLGGVVLFVLILAAGFMAHEPLPEGETGPEADSLAVAMQRSIGHQWWDSTGAITWIYAGRKRILWDRQRHLAQFTWGDFQVLVDLNKQSGLAWKAGQALNGEERDELVYTAWSVFCNDSFWLNPVSKLFDPGTSRSIVDLPDGEEGLLVTYSSGGVTPGDSYLWFLDENKRPVKWKMWVGIIPIGGISATWENWVTLPTGTAIATAHQIAGLLNAPITELRAAGTLAELVEGSDPFAPLFE